MKRINGAVVGVVALLSACAQSPLEGPPTVRMGRDQCVECGMLISSEPCSCAMIVERDGRREYAMFDDIGCMLDYARKSDRADKVVTEFVRDHGDRRWVAGDAAWYLAAPQGSVRTPMGSGVVAFATPEAAESARVKAGGRVVRRGELEAAAAGQR